MNEVLEAISSIPSPGFEEVNREDQEEMLNSGEAASSVANILDEGDSDDGDAASDQCCHLVKFVTRFELLVKNKCNLVKFQIYLSYYKKYSIP